MDADIGGLAIVDHVHTRSAAAIAARPARRPSVAATLRPAVEAILRTLPVPELAIVAALGLFALLVGAANGLVPSLPAKQALTMMGFHYLLPVVTMIMWGGVIFMTRRSGALFYYAAAFVCYAGVLTFHFNLKLWIPFINPASWDAFYWATDEALRPIVDACMAVRRELASLLGNIDTLYLFGFVMMFYVSFIAHAVQGQHVFRRLVIASLLVHALGALAYLVMPAVGPFLYEPGLNAVATSAQQGMWQAHQDLRAGGTAWIAENAQYAFTAGLAAMPSLHTAASAVFVWFAWRYCRGLLPLYIPAFVFILIEAVATRWHYVVDIPVGLALAALCIWIAERTLDRAPATRKHRFGT